VLKADLGQRLHHLDPDNRFWSMHGKSVEHFLGAGNCRLQGDRMLTISYAVGGAGAQKEIGARLVQSLLPRIREGKLRVNLLAGVRPEVREYFRRVRETCGPAASGVQVLSAGTMEEYFHQFNAAMRTTDILWTKPSELSFYTALGIPIIMSPTIGAQERFNRQWLFEIQAGIKQENPDHTDQWLFDWLSNGRLAEAAWNGFLKARKLGTYKILEVLKTGRMTRHDSPVLR
jgi:UDP-N-acetylglucosamine:LPS N-acetylglucosamine transferase